MAVERSLVAAGWPATSQWWLDTLARWWGRRTRRLVARVGRRGGKSTTMCRVAVAWAIYGAHALPPGSRGVFVILSVDKREASERLFTICRILEALGVRHESTADEIRLADMPVVFRVYAARVAAVGMNCIGLIADELARWRDDDTGANPATQVLGSVRPAMADQPEAPEVLISSPWSTLDAHHEAIAMGDTEHQTVAVAPTWVARPDLTEAMTRELEPDEQTRRREYGAEPMTALGSGVFDQSALIAAATDDLVLPVLPGPGVSVVCGADWGFVHNASAVAICHRTGDSYVLADSLELHPEPNNPLRPSEVARAAADVMRRQQCTTAMADAHYREAMTEHLSMYGIGAIDAPTDVPATYVRARTLFNLGRVRIPKQKQLLRDLAEVQQAPTSGGGLRIILPKRPGGSHADLVAAFILALWQRGGVDIRTPEPDPMARWEQAERDDLEREEQERRRLREDWGAGSGYISDLDG